MKEYPFLVQSRRDRLADSNSPFGNLVQRKLDLVLVCPIWPLSKFEERSDFFKSKKGKEALRM